MKNISSAKNPILLIFLFCLFLSGCQEEGAPPPPLPSPESIASQSAPLPKDQKLEILMLGPSGRVEKLSQIVAMFNQPMAALGDYMNVPAGAMKVDPPMEGAFKWLNQYTLAFIPKEPLEGNAEIRAEIPAGLKALSGAVLAEGKAAEISLPPLGIIQAAPLVEAPLDEEAALKPLWAVTLNQKTDPESLAERAFFVYEKDGRELEIAARISENQDGRYSHYTGYTSLLSPREKLPKNVPYKIVLKAGIESLSGPIPSERLETNGAATFGPLSAGLLPNGGEDPVFDPAEGLYLEFSNPVRISEAAAALKIDNGYDLSPLRQKYPPRQPEAEEGAEDVDDYERYLYIPGGFAPNISYSASFDEGLKDAYGQEMGAKPPIIFKTGAYESYLRLDGDFGLMERSGGAKIPLVMSNIEKASVRGYALSIPEAVRFLANFYGRPGDGSSIEYEEAMKGIGQKPFTMDIAPPPGATVNGPIIMPLDLAALFGEKLSGHLLFVETSYGANESAVALRQVSDIGLAVKTGQGEGLVWATNLALGRSWPGVDLSLYAEDGEILWRGKSDARGLASLPSLADLLKGRPADAKIFIAGQAEGQMSIWGAAWDDGLEGWRFNLDYNNPSYAHNEKRHWLLSALPLYRPGETAEFKLIAREKKADDLNDLAGQKLIMTIEDARGDRVLELEITSDEYGSISHSLPLPADCALGEWRVMLRAENDEYPYMAGTFMVMDYRAPAFEISHGEMPRKAVAGEKANLSLKAAYHFGGPVAGQPISYEITKSPLYGFTLPGLSDFTFTNDFSDADEYDDSGYGYQEPHATVAAGKGALDRAGKFALPLKLGSAPGAKPRPRTYNAYFSITDVDQRVIASEASFTVHPSEIYPGIKAETSLGRAGESVSLKALAADLDGKLAPGREMSFTIFRREWRNVRRRTAGSAYEYVSRAVDEVYGRHEAISADEPLSIPFTPERAGYYWVLAETEDDAGRKNQAAASFYVSGSGPVGWRMNNNDQLTLVADKKEYRPGDTARILVESPFSEGEGLLTIERAGVRQARIFSLESNSPVLEIPITEDDSPNIYVSVLLSRGRVADKPGEGGLDLGKPAIRLGCAELKVPGKRDLLNVAVRPARGELGPGEEVEVEIRVKDNEGRPFSEAKVALIAADAATIQLAGDDMYYPDRFFGRDEPLSVMTADNLASLVSRRNWGDKGGSPGGGGGPGQFGAENAQTRSLFKALAHFEPNLALDSDGRAFARIKMPENLTTFKIYAVATGHGKKGGTGVAEALVTKDLLLRPALLGYAGQGDSFRAAAILTNRGDESGEAFVSLSGENFILEEGEEAEKTLEMEPGESREISFAVKTPKAGRASFVFTGTMGNARDAAEYSIDITPPNKLVTQASYERLTPGEKRVDLALPGDFDPDRGGFFLTLSPSLLGLLSGPFEYLAEYPHRCIEQETSRAFGALMLLDLHKFLPEGADEAKLSAARAQAAAHLDQLARWDNEGGFTFWPGGEGRERSVYLSAYILEFILSAAEKGLFPKDDGLKGRVSGFLEASLKPDHAWPAWYSAEATEESRGYALAALSRAGANVAAEIELYYQKRHELSLGQLTNLIRAIAFQSKGKGQAGQLRELLPLLNRHINVAGGGIQFVRADGLKELWAGPARDSAKILETLCLAAPHNRLVEPLVLNLFSQARAGGGHFGNTHDNALALSAFSVYARALEAEKPDLRLNAFLGSRAMLQAWFKSQADAPKSARLPLTAANGPPAIIYKATGQGQAWAALKLESAPLSPDLSADTGGGFMLSRSFTVIKPEGREGAERFRRGDVVRVTTTMMLPAPRYNVALEDPVPAGFEPINFSLGDADRSLLAESGEGLWNENWPDHREIRPGRVIVYKAHLPAGVYTSSYLARAITPGRYITTGPGAEEMYSPETYGRGEGQILTVE